MVLILIRSIEDLKRIGFRFGCKITTDNKNTASQIGQMAKQNRQKRSQTPINKGFDRNVKNRREKCNESRGSVRSQSSKDVVYM